jgi:NAD(P)-dependent dehydrogenase (short-subunit alcohol dehydrogenase family)
MAADPTRLDGRVAIVTGAAGGIGRGIARVLSAAGARIVIGDLIDAGDAVAEIRAAGGEATSVGVDVGVAEQADELVAFARRSFGAVDVLVNNAGIDTPEGDPWDLPDGEWQRTIDVNLTGVFYCSRAAIRDMREGGTSGGAIVNISSHFAWMGAPGISPAYHASKAGVLGLTMSLATHLGPSGIRANAIAPALVMSRDFGWSPEEEAHRRAEYALGPGRPDDIGEAVRFLVSPAARWITGTVLYLHGGHRRTSPWS